MMDIELQGPIKSDFLGIRKRVWVHSGGSKVCKDGIAFGDRLSGRPVFERCSCSVAIAKDAIGGS